MMGPALTPTIVNNQGMREVEHGEEACPMNYDRSGMRVDLFCAAVPTCKAVEPGTAQELQPVRREA